MKSIPNAHLTARPGWRFVSALSNTETGPCDKCQGSGTYFDRRCGDVECDECHGHGWFNDGVAGDALNAPHEFVCAIHRGGKCTCSVLDRKMETRE